MPKFYVKKKKTKSFLNLYQTYTGVRPHHIFMISNTAFNLLLSVMCCDFVFDRPDDLDIMTSVFSSTARSA